MVGRKLKHSATLKASTILEVVISMVIIILVFGIAMMIFTNVTRTSISLQKLKAEALLQEVLRQSEQSHNFANQSVTVKDILVEVDVESYSGDQMVKLFHLTAYDINRQKVGELKKIIITDDK